MFNDKRKDVEIVLPQCCESCVWREQLNKRDIRMAVNMWESNWIENTEIIRLFMGNNPNSSPEIISACYMMSMVTLPAGTQTRQRYLMLSSLWFLTMMMRCGGLRAVSWKTMAVRMINLHSTLNLCGICCSSLMVYGA